MSMEIVDGWGAIGCLVELSTAFGVARKIICGGVTAAGSPKVVGTAWAGVGCWLNRSPKEKLVWVFCVRVAGAGGFESAAAGSS